MQDILIHNVRLYRVFGFLLTYVVLVSVAIIMTGPFLWMVSTALKPTDECYVYPPVLFPSQLSLENVREVMDLIPVFRYMANTAYLAIVGTVLQLVVCAMAAYAFSRLRFPGRDLIFFAYLGTMMIPGAATMVPTFLIMKWFGWMDSYSALIIPTLASAFATFLLRQFFLTIPNELEDAARIDGAGRVRFFLSILLPLSGPVLTTLAVFNFRGRWNAFLWPMLILRTQNKLTIQLGLASFRSEHRTMQHLVMTGVTISVIPVLIVFIAAQKYFVQSIVLSGLKG
jgi:multiple sugar transport system permease protein